MLQISSACRYRFDYLHQLLDMGITVSQQNEMIHDYVLVDHNNVLSTKNLKFGPETVCRMIRDCKSGSQSPLSGQKNVSLFVRMMKTLRDGADFQYWELASQQLHA